MVNVRQKNIRAFVFSKSDDEEVILYLRKNAILLTDFMLIFSYKLSDQLVECLRELHMNYVEEGAGEIYLTKSREKNDTSVDDKSVPSNEVTKTMVFHRNIRSGEEIVNDGDVTIFGNINSGAIIHCGGNAQIFGQINGNIFCDGEYIIAQDVKDGNLLLNGIIIDREDLIGGMKKIYRKDDHITIEEL